MLQLTFDPRFTGWNVLAQYGFIPTQLMTQQFYVHTIIRITPPSLPTINPQGALSAPQYYCNLFCPNIFFFTSWPPVFSLLYLSNSPWLRRMQAAGQVKRHHWPRSTSKVSLLVFVLIALLCVWHLTLHLPPCTQGELSHSSFSLPSSSSPSLLPSPPMFPDSHLPSFKKTVKCTFCTQQHCRWGLRLPHSLPGLSLSISPLDSPPSPSFFSLPLCSLQQHSNTD